LKALILGIPGSGTSYFAGLMSALGWTDAPPTFSKASHGYASHESVLGRAVNRLAFGETETPWPTRRWHAHYPTPNPTNDPECFALAHHFVTSNDERGKDWYFKNPESVQFFSTIWNQFEWDFVVGAYRHPDDSVETIHSQQRTHHKQMAWLRWMRVILDSSTVLVRFPDDAARLCDALGVDVPERFGMARGRPRNRSEHEPEAWASEIWHELEASRWQMEREKVA